MVKTNSRQRESKNALVAKKELNLELYKEVLRGKNDHRVTQMGIRSTHHSIYTQEVNKKGLSSYDEKRWICEDGNSTYAHGHFKTKHVL